MQMVILKQRQLRSLLSGLNSTVLFNEPMNKYTSFRIGGTAEAMAFPCDETELSEIIHITRDERIPLFILGKGTNILVGDKGLQGIVVSLSSNLTGECFRQITKIKEVNDLVYIYAGAGTALARLLRYTIQNSLSGLEFTAGIPGSLGGAVIMNAGSYGREMKDVIDLVRVFNSDGRLTVIPTKYILYTYRETSIHGTAVAGAVLRLSKGDPQKIKKTVEENIFRKRMSQPLSKPSAGSIFMNPSGTMAWKLIDSAGMRNASSGGAAVSPLYAN